MPNLRSMTPASALTARTSPEPGAIVVTVMGDIDITTKDDFAKTLERALNDRHRRPVILDLTDIRFFAACGVGCVNEARAAAARNDIELRLAAGQVAARPLRLAGSDVALSLYSSVAEARRGS